MIDYLYLVGLFLFSFIVSTLLIRLAIPKLKANGIQKKILPESNSSRPFDPKSTGFWIGFCETLLIFILVCKGEFSALAIVIAAKEFVRKEKLEQNPSYYLLGTLVNLSVAVLFAVIAKSIVEF